MAGFVVCCQTCNYLGESAKTKSVLAAELALHRGHHAGIYGARWVVYARDLAPMLPEEFRQMYWQRKLDEFFAGEGIVATADGPVPDPAAGSGR